jgi:hypothetical protein
MEADGKAKRDEIERPVQTDPAERARFGSSRAVETWVGVGVARAARPLLPLLKGWLGAETVVVSELDGATREAMWALYREHYERVEERQFFADLDNKHHAILLRDLADKSLQGFTTLHVDRVEVDGTPYVIVFSGDTIIAEDYQGQSALHREFVRYIMRVALTSDGARVYWFLISKGYKTYLLLSRNFNEYWPRHDGAMPEAMRRLLGAVARRRFGSSFEEASGRIVFDPPGPKLKGHVAPISEAALTAPDVRFFVEKNPGHADGDELCCLGRVDLQLGLSYAWRWGRRLVVRGVGGLSRLEKAGR